MAKTETVIVGCKLPHGLSFKFEDKTVTFVGLNKTEIINGFGISRGVPTVAWEWFAKTYKDARFIKKGLVFMVTDEESARSASAEREKNKTGLEQAPKKANGLEPFQEKE